jgi:DNA-binding transcriptional ArsR family regulator
MSGSEEDTYSIIFTSLKHPIRRGILRSLSDNPQSFSDLQRLLKIESSHLTYHLEGLGNLLVKTEEGKYALSSLGEAAVSTMKRVEEPPMPYQRAKLPDNPHRTHLLSSKNLSRIILFIGIALLASSFLFFYLSSSSNYDHVTAYNYVANLGTNSDPITNISIVNVGYGCIILLQPHDYLTVSMENLPTNGTARLMFQGLPLDDAGFPTNISLNDLSLLQRSSENGFLDFRNALSTEIGGELTFTSKISQTYFITVTLHHYEMAKWVFFSVGIVLASSGLAAVFKSKR